MGKRPDHGEPPALTREQALALIDQIHAQIPAGFCTGACARRECTVMMMSPLERDRLPDPYPDYTEATKHVTCPLLSDDARCTAYEHRPTMCRLYGVVQDTQLRCQEDCNPHGPFLSATDQLAFFQAVYLIGDPRSRIRNPAGLLDRLRAAYAHPDLAPSVIGSTAHHADRYDRGCVNMATRDAVFDLPRTRAHDLIRQRAGQARKLRERDQAAGALGQLHLLAEPLTGDPAARALMAAMRALLSPDPEPTAKRSPRPPTPIRGRRAAHGRKGRRS